MKKLLLALGILALVCSSPAMAARNAGGAILLHTNDTCNYSLGWDYCGDLGPWSAPLPPTCDGLVTTTNHDGPTVSSIIWAVAAFPDGSSPAVTAYQFGIGGTIPCDYYDQVGYCPSTGIEVPDATWPCPGTGTAVGTGVVLSGQMFKIYWFAAYSLGPGAILRTQNYPGGDGHAEFADDSSPPQIDFVNLFGAVGWQVPGELNCPQAVPPSGACCFLDGRCEVLERIICDGQGGVYQGDFTVCVPNPCPQPVGACCFTDGSCRDLLEADCLAQGGAWEGIGTNCVTFQCPQPQPEACCFTDGHCENLLADACRTAGGTPEGPGTNCDTFQCPQPPTGACCIGTDCTITTQENCSGLWQGPDTTCEPENPCATPVKSTTWGAIKGQYR